jgi:hypothetical protein
VKRRVQGYYDGAFRGDPRHVGKIAHARTPCSCWMCGNPRRHLRERSVQERRLSDGGVAGCSRGMREWTD